MPPGTWACVDGELHPRHTAAIPIDDLGFLTGDGVFETLRLYRGRPFLFHEHLQRLRASARLLELDVPFSDAEFLEQARRLVERNGLDAGDARLRLTLTRAAGGGATAVVTADAYEPPSPEVYARGVRVCWSREAQPSTPWSQIKSTSRPWQVQQRRRAAQQGCFEMLSWNDAGQLTEGSYTNVFCVDHDGTLRTPAPADGCLPGISRAAVLDIARELGIAYIEGRVPTGVIDTAREVFLTGSLIEVMPVRGVGERDLSGNAPWPVAQRILAAYRDRVAVSVR